MNSRDEENKLRQIKEDITGKPHPDPIAVAIDKLAASTYSIASDINRLATTMDNLQCIIGDLNMTMKRVHRIDGNI